jgi:ankyrin repeat protein
VGPDHHCSPPSVSQMHPGARPRSDVAATTPATHRLVLVLPLLLLLLSSPVALTGTSETALLHDAAAAGDHEALRDLLAPEGVRALIDHEKGGMTALRHAAHLGHTECVRLLLESGAQPDLHTKRGTTALHLAVEQRHAAAAEALLVGGASSTAATKKGGQTALMLAAQAGDSEIVALLLAHRASADQRNMNNATALFYAAGAGHLEAVRTLLAVGAEADWLDASGASPLMAAVGGGHKAVATALLEEGHATVDLSGSDGMTALSYAADRGQAECIKVLLAAGAKPNRQAGMSPQNRRTTGLPMDDAPQTTEEEEGFGSGTALHAAAYNANVNSVQVLIDGGANPAQRNEAGQSAQDIARKVSSLCACAVHNIIMLCRAILYLCCAALRCAVLCCDTFNCAVLGRVCV